MKDKRDIAILVVSFGTSHTATYQKTIAVIEREIHETYVNYPLYSAWTSSMIRKIVKKRDNLHVFSVKEALEQMHKDGITHVVVQPTHVLDGTENTAMKKDIHDMRHNFKSITIGAPLLATREDINLIVDFMKQTWNLQPDEFLVYVGHGSEHDSNIVYDLINKTLQTQGCTNIILGTMKASPSMDDILRHLKLLNISKIILAPFMIVAGSHAENELAGDTADSWKSTLEKEGYEVECVLKGLGEYEEIRQIFLEHLNQVIAQ